MDHSALQTKVPPFTTREIAWLAAVFLALALVRLPALAGRINLSHDATEYIDIARNFAAGNGLVLNIRAYFFGDSLLIPYPAASLRSILYPLLMGGIYSVVPSAAVFQWFNFALFFLNLVLLVQILRPLLPFHLLAYSMLLAGLSEPMFLTSIFPWTEQTAFTWLLIAMLMASRELHRRWGFAGAMSEGVVAGMAAISRPEYILVGMLFLAWLLLRKERHVSLGAAFLAGWLLPMATLAAMNLHIWGRTFIPGDYLFRSREYSTYFSWDNANNRSPLRFVAANWIWIVGRIVRNLANYAAKLIGWKNLFLLSAAVPLVMRNAFRQPIDWRKQQVALVPALFLCAYCLVWAGMDRERYLLPITTFWLPQRATSTAPLLRTAWRSCSSFSFGMFVNVSVQIQYRAL